MGIAIGVFMPITVASLLLLVAGSCLSTWIARLFGLQRLVSGFTAPFIISVWILLVTCNWMMPSLLLPSGDAVTAQTLSFLQAFCLNIGQVMFQGNTVLAGVFFLLGILVNSRINGLYTILGALLPIPFALLLGVDYAALNAGLMGYNGVLCAIALGDKTWERRCVSCNGRIAVRFASDRRNGMGDNNSHCTFCCRCMDCGGITAIG